MTDFFMITSNCLTPGIDQVMAQSAYLMSSVISLEKMLLFRVYCSCDGAILIPRSA